MLSIIISTIATIFGGAKIISEKNKENRISAIEQKKRSVDLSAYEKDENAYKMYSEIIRDKYKTRAVLGKIFGEYLNEMIGEEDKYFANPGDPGMPKVCISSEYTYLQNQFAIGLVKIYTGYIDHFGMIHICFWPTIDADFGRVGRFIISESILDGIKRFTDDYFKKHGFPVRVRMITKSANLCVTIYTEPII